MRRWNPRAITSWWMAAGIVGPLAIATPAASAAQGSPPAPPSAPAPAAAQNPSPMIEETRAHERLTQREVPGSHRTFNGPAGKPVDVLIPDGLRPGDDIDVMIEFLGAAWLPEYAASRLPTKTVAAVVNLGAGSGIYDRSFSDPTSFDSLLAAIDRETTGAVSGPAKVRRIILVGFSAGHGAVRAILREPRHFARVDAILLLDGMHTSYVPEGTPLAAGGTLDEHNLDAFIRFARAAVRGDKRFLITHSEIFPGTFASTTETADHLLHALGLKRTPVLQWGPRGMQQLSEVKSGNFELMGFAGNSAPDHIDQFQGMPEFLERLGRP